MADTNLTLIDEESPLLSSPVEAPKKRRRSPLPKLQIAVVLLLQLCEPLTSQSIYPYINQVCSSDQTSCEIILTRQTARQ
jgi:hypothetical protein